jgi:hypothetical protein
MTSKFHFQAMTVDKANAADDNDKVPASQKNNIVTAKTFEMMTEDEVEQIMAERSRTKDRPEWGKDRFGNEQPLSAWDRLWP